MNSDIDIPVEDLRLQLHLALDRIVVDDQPWPVVHADLRRRLREHRRRVLSAVAVVGAAAAVASVIVAVQPAARHSTSPVVPGTVPLRIVASAQFRGTTPPRIATGAGVVFAALWDSGTVVRLDPVTLQQTGSVRVGSAQNGPLSVAYGAGSLWVLNFHDGRLWRIDPSAMRPTMKIKLGAEPSQLAFGDNAVWVTVCCDTTHTANRQRLLRINPTSGAITGSIAMPGDGETVNVAVGPQVLLVSSQNAPVSVVDPQTLTVQRRLHAPCDFCDGAPGIAVGEGSFYVTSATSVLRYSDSTGKIIAESPPFAVGSTATPVVLAPDGLWLTSSDQLVRLAVTDLRVTDRVPLSAATEVALAEPSMYVSAPGRLVRLSREAPSTTATPTPTADGAGITAPTWAKELAGEVAIKCGNSFCLMRPDGTGERPLDATFPEWDPAWSPDGRRIAFRGYYGTGDGEYAIYLVNSDGCHVTRLPGTDGFATPTWSADGSRLAFAAGGGISVINASGRALHPVTTGIGNQLDSAPSWSATNRIAFVRAQRGDPRGEIYTMDPDGSHLAAITADSASYAQPAWSPDGSTLAMVVSANGNERIGAPLTIDVANADGSHRHPVTPRTWSSFDPTWTPDGRLVFLASKPAGTDAYLVNPNGSGLKRVYNGPAGQDGIEQITWGPPRLDAAHC
jgi:Tol biopolymer transport system component